MACSVLTVLLSLLLSTAVAEIVRYDGHKVIRVQATNRDQVEWLVKLHHETPLDFWTHPSLVRPTDIRLEPADYKNITDQLIHRGFNYRVVHEDVQQLIESAGQHPHGRDKRWIIQLFQRGFQVPDNFASYYQIYKWMMAKEKEFPSIMKVESIGKTYERMEQYIAKIGEPGVDKPIIWIDSGIHGREWISVTTGVNIIDKLLNGYKTKDPQVLELLKNFDWYILPVANPDGYIFTHYRGGRLWRKTRTNYGNGMYGADPNRNWDYKWCETGSSRLPNMSSYCGLKPWSEKCVENMKNTLLSIKSRLRVYLTIHSYGQFLFVPYAWSANSYPQDYRQLLSAGQAAAAAMRKSSGAIYQVGRVPDFIYEASGSSMDWVKATLGTKYVFGLELRPASAENNLGFIVSRNQIKPVAQEVWEGLKVMAENAKTNDVVFG